ncbi:MAG: DUF72 domain-containing protein, partial [Candidatus Hadarchaeum sp.]
LNDYYDPSLKRWRIKGLQGYKNFKFHRMDVSEIGSLAFRDAMSGLPVVVEFRNARWLTPETFAFLEENELGFCCVDEPRLKGLIPPIAEATSRIAYVRFHGRNAKKWWRYDEPWERYDYTYSREELEEWVPKIKDLEAKAEKTFLFANNHWRAQAVDTARQLRLLLL